MTDDHQTKLAAELEETLSLSADQKLARSIFDHGPRTPKAGATPPSPPPPTVLERTTSSVEQALASLLAHRADLERQINDLYGKRIETDRAILALNTAVKVMGR